MKGAIIKDWNKVDFSDRKQVEKFAGAVQHFMSVPENDKMFKAAMQAFTMKGDFPSEILQVLEKYHITSHYDNAYEQIFDIKDFTGSKESGFDILDVQSSLVFRKVKAGDEVEVYKASGAKTSVSFDSYGGAMGLDKTWFDDSKYWNIEDTMIEFRNKFYSGKASAFYTLIEALATTNDVTWQTSIDTLAAGTDGYTASRDVATIRAACDAVLGRIKDKGYNVGPNTPFFLLAPNSLRNRINAALTRLNQGFGGSSKQLDYNVVPLYTLMLSSSSDYYVGIPKVKLKGGNRQDLTLYNAMNILRNSETVAGWGRYGGAIGDTEQLVRCETS